MRTGPDEGSVVSCQDKTGFFKASGGTRDNRLDDKTKGVI